VLEVSLDEEVTEVNVAPLAGRLANVSVRVSGAPAQLVLLLSDNGAQQVHPQQNSVRFSGIEPGDYALVATTADGQMAAYQEISVAGADVSVYLAMAAAPRLSLVCAVDGEPLLRPEEIRFYFRRAGRDETPERLLCGREAVFSPGRWQVAAIPPSGMYVAAVLDAGAGQNIHEILLEPGQSRELRIALRSSPAMVEGTVTTKTGNVVVGAPVFLDPLTDELRRRLGGTRSTRTDAEGVYRIPGLPPGQYEVVSSYQIWDPESGGWQRGAGVFFEVEEGEKEVVDLPLTKIE
jgi:hypothetical protein